MTTRDPKDATVPDDAPDYVLAERDLREIISGAGLTFAVDHAPGTDYSEKGTQRFAFSLSKDGREIRGEWSCGSAVALSAYVREPFKARGGDYAMTTPAKDLLRAAAAHRGPCVDDAVLRVQIRRHYRPDAFAIVSSLLADTQCVDGYDDWAQWAEDLGMFSGKGATAAEVREVMADWAIIKERTPTLRAMLGEHYAAAIECAGRL